MNVNGCLYILNISNIYKNIFYSLCSVIGILTLRYKFWFRRNWSMRIKTVPSTPLTTSVLYLCYFNCNIVVYVILN